MRKLLVASQKGGVGKTTTSMNLAAAAARSGTRVLLLDADPLSNISTALNLAEHPHRQLLRQAGIDLPGVLITNIVPGLDVLSPYDEGRCSDDDLDRLLRALSQPVARQCYGCTIVDVPPFLGANPSQLIGSCDEFLLVMRAEAMAYRTLPAFLELVQRSSRAGHVIELRGILLTLPEGEELGGRWERELRGRLGARILPEVIPHDDAIGKALWVGQINSHLHPDSPAGRQYSQLVAKLGLADESRPAAGAEQIVQALRGAALTVQPAVAATATPTPIVADPTPVETENDSDTVDFFAPAPESVKPVVPPIHRVRRLSRSGEILRPTRPERSVPPVTPPLTPSSRTKPATDSVVSAVPPANPVPAAPPATANALAQLWPLWILLGAVLGGGLRFLPLSPSLLPILVGLGVAIIVVVVLRSMATMPDNSASSPENPRGRTRSREQKKSSSRSDAKKDAVARLASLTKGTPKSNRRDPHAN
ncbi:MAG TPA: ParA family protein [Gemmataceae bacterium]|nr:ParA family protein [Gemmataceae bacterium]